MPPPIKIERFVDQVLVPQCMKCVSDFPASHWRNLALEKWKELGLRTNFVSELQRLDALVRFFEAECTDEKT